MFLPKSPKILLIFCIQLLNNFFNPDFCTFEILDSRAIQDIRITKFSSTVLNNIIYYEQLVCLSILWEIYLRFMSEQSSSFISVMLYLRFIVVLFGWLGGYREPMKHLFVWYSTPIKCPH